MLRNSPMNRQASRLDIKVIYDISSILLYWTMCYDQKKYYPDKQPSDEQIGVVSINVIKWGTNDILFYRTLKYGQIISTKHYVIKVVIMF